MISKRGRGNSRKAVYFNVMKVYVLRIVLCGVWLGLHRGLGKGGVYVTKQPGGVFHQWGGGEGREKKKKNVRLVYNAWCPKVYGAMFTVFVDLEGVGRVNRRQLGSDKVLGRGQ